MRPNEFCIPQQAFQEKKPLIYDRVFFVPEESEDKAFDFPSWSHLFGNDRPVIIEYCSGNGTWIAKKAEENPEINWVAVEMQMNRGKKIWSKMQNKSLTNLFVVIAEGESCTRRFFKDQSIHEIYINFPDPWPKRRHAKNRLINERFVREMARVLLPNAFFILVTDDENYSKITLGTVLKNASFKSFYPIPHYLSNPQNYGESFFDSLWREKGKEIRLHKFIKLSLLNS